MFAKELKEGDLVTFDDGFSCIHAGEQRTLYLDNGDLVFDCEQGTHWVGGQYDDEIEEYVGIIKL